MASSQITSSRRAVKSCQGWFVLTYPDAEVGPLPEQLAPVRTRRGRRLSSDRRYAGESANIIKGQQSGRADAAV